MIAALVISAVIMQPPQEEPEPLPPVEIESAVDYEEPDSLVPICTIGESLTKSGGVYYGASGKETWYNLPMGKVINIMRAEGYTVEEYPFWIRKDGAKMLGSYVMIAADLKIRPRGTVLDTSLGKGLVVDTGAFAASNPYQIDIATNW